FFNDTATTEIYTLSLHDALPISRRSGGLRVPPPRRTRPPGPRCGRRDRRVVRWVARGRAGAAPPESGSATRAGESIGAAGPRRPARLVLRRRRATGDRWLRGGPVDAVRRLELDGRDGDPSRRDEPGAATALVRWSRGCGPPRMARPRAAEPEASGPAPSHHRARLGVVGRT